MRNLRGKPSCSAQPGESDDQEIEVCPPAKDKLGVLRLGFVALDKHWKQRVASLPRPNGLAKVYYATELDQLVADLESHAKAWESA